jgi:hypothetical protein
MLAMQSQHSYPRRRKPFAAHWHARVGARATDPPLSRKHASARRIIEIRRLFLETLGGHATLDQVLDAACRAGLLDDVADVTCVDVVRRALRPICADLRSQPGWYQPQDTSQTTPG